MVDSSSKARVFVFPNWSCELEKTTKESCEALAAVDDLGGGGGVGLEKEDMCRALNLEPLWTEKRMVSIGVGWKSASSVDSLNGALRSKEQRVALRSTTERSGKAVRWA